MKQKPNYMMRMWLLGVAVLVILLGLRYLPTQIGAWELRPVDLLSDLRRVSVEDESSAETHTPIVWEEEGDSIKGDTLTPTVEEARGRVQIERDSLRQILLAEQTEMSNAHPALVEDYSEGRNALVAFFGVLRRRAELGRPVRIAFLGDSFIEGDILSAPLRESLQSRYGGSGVGWMAPMSVVSSFRQSIRHQYSAWEEKSLATDKHGRYPLTLHYYTASLGAKLSLRPPRPEVATHVSLYYRSSGAVSLDLKGDSTSYPLELEPSEAIAEVELSAALGKGIDMSIAGGAVEGLRSYGLALESRSGIIVDNYSLRGHSGLLLGSLDAELARQYAALRPYDLLILEYGLNYASDKMDDYSGYVRQMSKVIDRLREIYPQSSILLLGVSDRGEKYQGEIRTKRAILKLHEAQRELAQHKGLAFWSLLGAMRELGGIATFSDKGWANKDYTHLTHRGGRELARLLYNALEAEAEYYETIDP